MRFGLFLLANALLFIRPSEFIAELYAVELYRYAILACLAAAFPVVIQQLTARPVGVPPIAGCVLGLLPAVIASNLLGGNAEMLQDNATEFVKILVYFLLMLALLNNVARLRQFLVWLCLFSAVLAAIAVLRYHADIGAPVAAAPTQASSSGPRQSKQNGTFVVDMVRDPRTGQKVPVRRMCGTGIFNDPNDLGLALVCAIPLCLAMFTDPTRRAARPFWGCLMALFAYALMQTHSRGGFLALMAGMGTLLHLRYGGKKTILAGLLVFPLLLVVFAGRMTDISTGSGTSQSRIQLWSDSLTFFQGAPLFGIGMENYRAYSRHVAHNSYIHCYTELGLFGGTLFLGAFYFALHGVYKLRPQTSGAAEELPVVHADPEDADTAELRRLHPFLMAMFVAYAVGIAFLSRGYVVPTYMMLGLATVYLRLCAPTAGQQVVALTRMALPKLAGVSVAFLIASYTFVRLFVQWG